jgi:DNA polymerase zeta
VNISSLPGKTKEQAFSIGYEIAEAITAMNPSPIKLKFEKVISHEPSSGTQLRISLQVYLPCVLLAKKRYVGFKYENVDEVEPGFDAKGIETVRRDGVLAQRKMVENCIK